MGELQPGPVYRDQAQLLGRRQRPRIRPGAVAGSDAQVRSVGYGGQQQRGARLLGQVGEPGGDHGAPAGQSAAAARAAHRLLTAGSSAIHAWPARSAPSDFRPPAREPAVLPSREEGEAARPAGGWRLPLTAARDPAPGSLGQSRTAVPGRGRLPEVRPARRPGGCRRRPASPASCGSSQWASSATTTTGDCSDRSESSVVDGHPSEQRIGSNRIRSQAQRPHQGLGLPAGKTGGTGQHRPQELM